MIKLELTEDELRRVLAALRNQELSIEDELERFGIHKALDPVVVRDAPTAHCKALQQISRECFEVAEKIRVQWRGTW